MKFRTVFNFLPAFIFFPKIILTNVNGIVLGPFIFIKKEDKENIEILEHELVHVKQFYRTFGLFCIFYRYESALHFSILLPTTQYIP